MTRKRKTLLLLGLILVILPITAFVPKIRVENALAKQWTGLSSPSGVAIGDFNYDGLNDIAIAEYTGGKVTVYSSDGTTVIKQWTGLGGARATVKT